MEPITLRFPPDLLDELDDEAEARGFSSRSEYIRHLLRNRTATDPNTSGDTDPPPDRIRYRVDDLERRVAELEHGEDTPRTDGVEEDAPAGPTPTESTGAGGEPDEVTDAVTGHTGAEDSPPVSGADDDLAEQVREHLEVEDRPPKTGHGRDAVVDVFRALRAEGTLPTSTLQERVFGAYDGEWASPRTMWNAIDRYLEDVPGVEKGGYGEWTYAGDEAVREVLGGA